MIGQRESHHGTIHRSEMHARDDATDEGFPSGEVV